MNNVVGLSDILLVSPLIALFLFNMHVALFLPSFFQSL